MRGHFLSDEDIIAQEADFGKRNSIGGRIGGVGGRSRPFGAIELASLPLLVPRGA